MAKPKDEEVQGAMWFALFVAVLWPIGLYGMLRTKLNGALSLTIAISVGVLLAVLALPLYAVIGVVAATFAIVRVL